MAKGQKRSNREQKKPKQSKPKAIPSMASGVAQPRPVVFGASKKK